MKTDIIMDSVKVLSTILDIEEDTKLVHGTRVGVVCAWVAEALGMVPQQRWLYYSGLLHDIGAVGLPDHITHYAWQAPSELQSEIRAHPLKGMKLLTKIPLGAQVAEWVYLHHERYDGRGYPLGLAKEDVPLQAQIIRIADSLDLVIRSHGTNLLSLELLKEWGRTVSGREVSPALVQVLFDEVLNEERYQVLINMERLEQENERMSRLLNPGVNDDEDAQGDSELLNRISLVMAEVIDFKDRYTLGHSLRVAVYALAVARQYGIVRHGLLQDLALVAFLHDAGKVGVARTGDRKKRALDCPGMANNEKTSFDDGGGSAEL
ncbi:MAG TPA: HD domain-containing protein [Syntrophothermus lipocalidus]|nr:HD domain-containing protein [Syntrophothermus lipocalidus]